MSLCLKPKKDIRKSKEKQDYFSHPIDFFFIALSINSLDCDTFFILNNFRSQANMS